MFYELDAFCEIDGFAEQSYCAIHGESSARNLKDVTEADFRSMPSPSMLCGGSPCQNFSVAGKGAGSLYKCGGCGHEWNPLTVHWSKRSECPECGSEEVEGTQSSLVCHFLRAVRQTKPKFGMFENVKALTNKKHRDTFELFLKELDEYGYNTYWKVLNAKDFGIPQNRERVIVVFVRKELDNGKFVIPEGRTVPIPFLSMLDDDVETEFYVGEKRMKILMGNLKERMNESTMVIGSSQKNAFVGDESECPSLTQAMGSGGGQTPMVVVKLCENPVLALMEEDVPENLYITGEKVEKFLEEYFSKKREATADGIVKAGNTEPKILVQSGHINDSNATANRVYDSRGLDPALKAEAGGGGAKTGWYLLNSEPDGNCRVAIRKLTPKECFRLMGFDDADYEAAKAAGVSNSQLYKQCGNSIVVDMLYYVLKSLKTAIPDLFGDFRLLSLFSGIGAFEKALGKLGGPMQHDWDWEAWERRQEGMVDCIAVSERNGNRHTPGADSEQRIESEGKRVTNTLSTVQKDSMVMEVKK